jgi:aspartyl protease family protein
MRWPIIAIILVLAIALAASGSGGLDLGGLETGALVSLAFGLVMAIWIGGGVLRDYSGRWGEGARSLAAWLLIILGVVALYAFRFELASFANRVAGVVVPGLVIVGSGGEVTVSRSANGHFSLPMRLNGREAGMLFDTGASTIVLRSEDARALGITLSLADFTVGISTANGRSTAAPVTLKLVEVGDIREEDVQALVAKPGTLRENLLGMSFLERLSSYEVRGDRLILRGRGG